MKKYSLLKTFRVTEAMAKAIEDLKVPVSKIARRAVMADIIKKLKTKKAS